MMPNEIEDTAVTLIEDRGFSGALRFATNGRAASRKKDFWTAIIREIERLREQGR